VSKKPTKDVSRDQLRSAWTECWDEYKEKNKHHGPPPTSVLRYFKEAFLARVGYWYLHQWSDAPLEADVDFIRCIFQKLPPEGTRARFMYESWRGESEETESI
jgi:hypothetical protein